MLTTSIPRIVVSGLRGGSGKTIVSLSLIALLRNKGRRVVSFKKGPDYIDAGWLARASGHPCFNLDTFMMSPDQALQSFVEHSTAADIAVIEGNRGLFDGMDHKGTYSTAALAKLLDTPVIIAIDCTKTTNTIAALVLGCQHMDPDLSIGGIVLNRVATARQEGVIRKAIEERCGVPVVGAIPRLKKDPFPERHMGLTPTQEHAAIEESIDAVGRIGAEYLDIDLILKAAKSSNLSTSDERRATSVLSSSAPDVRRPTSDAPRIGIIRDSAFQFYYEENFEELRKRGADLVEVSPLSEESLPDIDALYIGGGFPETHAIMLAENRQFKESLRAAIQEGLPVYAECGGLMYLGESITLGDRTYPMTGIFPIRFGMKKRPRAHGYTVVEVEKVNAFYPLKTELRGHEFHYSEVLDVGEGEWTMAFRNKRGRGIIDNMDGISYKNVLAAYTHLHAIGSPAWADGMVKAAQRFKNRE